MDAQAEEAARIAKRSEHKLLLLEDRVCDSQIYGYRGPLLIEWACLACQTDRGH